MKRVDHDTSDLRMPLMMLTTVLLPAGLIVYGWSAQVSEDTMQVMSDTQPVNLELA
jgi:hypothetical protein